MYNTKDINFGINFVGHLTGEYGLGEGARSTLRAIEAVGIPFVLRDIQVDWHRNLDNSYTNFSEENPYPINLVHMVPEAGLLNRINPEYFKGKYNIGFWAWELPILPSGWLYGFSYFDEIWTYSNYCAEAISAQSPIPVVKMMSSIELSPPEFDREELGLPEDKFIFLFMFDFHSTLARKNPFATVDAFKRAFDKSNKDVLLVLKFSNAHFFPEKRDYLKSLTEGWPIHFIDGHLKKEELHALIANCDCYVSLHRSEGFGLTMSEAMYYGKPVIATGYSSNMEFMNVSNSFLVKYDIVTLDEDHGPYFRGNYWANPDIDHAAYLMQYVVNNPEEVQQRGERAARDIRDLLSPQVIGKKIQDRLESIVKRINHPTRITPIRQLQQQTALSRSQVEAWKQTARQVQNELQRSRSLIH